MIVVKVELHSAVTGKVTDLGQVVIDNIGGSNTHANYRVRTWRKGTDAYDALIENKLPVRAGVVENHARLSLPVLTLVRKALEAMRY